jgi:catechol 2,3-dioxygenase-like lactoylglutathione lyase family enzyme
MSIRAISAITLAVKEMPRSIAFYQALGLELIYGGPDQTFTSLKSGQAFVNLIAAPKKHIHWWGRVILHVDDVDALYQKVTAAGLATEAPPQDASWGERYFHLRDPDGHELSIAQPL